MKTNLIFPVIIAFLALLGIVGSVIYYGSQKIEDVDFGLGDLSRLPTIVSSTSTIDQKIDQEIELPIESPIPDIASSTDSETI